MLLWQSQADEISTIMLASETCFFINSSTLLRDRQLMEEAPCDRVTYYLIFDPCKQAKGFDFEIGIR
jgi:hypothetical protein